MTREEAVEYLIKLHHSQDICYACGECGGFGDDCKLQDVIDFINRPLGERLLEVLKEVHDGQN